MRTRSAIPDQNLERVRIDTEANGDALAGICKEARRLWDQPLEALEMYAEASNFLEEELNEIIDRMRSDWYGRPFPWEDIATGLGMTRQAAWSKYRRTVNVQRLPQRPGPRGPEDLIDFSFMVNPSFLKTGEITVPTSFNPALDDRLPGDGPSWALTLVTATGRTPGKLRHGHNNVWYYQLRCPTEMRAEHLSGLQPGDQLGVRITLLGPPTAELARSDVKGRTAQ